ncbi:MAG TPA: hypothetical protein VGP07_04020 [Polyangia bacterium]
MTKKFGTLWLLGVTALVACAAGCIETGGRSRYDNGDSNGGQSCLDSQYFTVQWGIDHGPGTISLTCAEISTQASHVELTTSAVAPDDLLIPSYNLSCHDGWTCADGSPCNMRADTVSGLPVGTAVLSASLVGSDASVLSRADGQGAAYAITTCDGWILPFAFTTGTTAAPTGP